jgi:uncharacterized protein (DUF1330 family)
MSAYCFVDVLRVKDAAKLEEYRGRVGPVVEKFGGRYLVAGGKSEVAEGQWRPTFPVIVEFPSLEQAHRWYGSNDYRDLKALRLAATDSNLVFIEGV